jgi:hypothetical protein
MYGSGVLSATHQLGLRTALPSYWHCDVVFSSERYYALFSSLSPRKLQHVLGINAPMIRTFSRSVTLGDDEDALVRMQEMTERQLLDTVVLEAPGRGRPPGPGLAEKRLFAATGGPRKLLRNLPYSTEVQHSFHRQLYDSEAAIPAEKCVEIAHGVYHRRMFRVPFNLPLPTRPDGELDAARCFFPDFPYLADVHGKLYYFNKGSYLTGNPEDRNGSVTTMRVMPSEGLLLECAERPAIPREVFLQQYRSPLPDGVKVVSTEANRVEVLCEQQEASVLYYADLYDKNWKATVDGQPTPILIANHAFKAVHVPAGKHRVVFRYSVPYLGLALTLYFLCVATFALACSCAALRSFSVGGRGRPPTQSNGNVVG